MALLFLADSYLPRTAGSLGKHEGKIDTSIIRITSARKWPEKIVFDTSQQQLWLHRFPSAEIPSPPMEKLRDAFVKVVSAKPVLEHAAKTHPKRKITRRPPASHFAAYRELPQNWFGTW
jgi:hypothetical protein